MTDSLHRIDDSPDDDVLSVPIQYRKSLVSNKRIIAHSRKVSIMGKKQKKILQRSRSAARSGNRISALSEVTLDKPSHTSQRQQLRGDYKIGATGGASQAATVIYANHSDDGRKDLHIHDAP